MGSQSPGLPRPSLRRIGPGRESSARPGRRTSLTCERPWAAWRRSTPPHCAGAGPGSIPAARPGGECRGLLPCPNDIGPESRHDAASSSTEPADRTTRWSGTCRCSSIETYSLIVLSRRCDWTRIRSNRSSGRWIVLAFVFFTTAAAAARGWSRSRDELPPAPLRRRLGGLGLFYAFEPDTPRSVPIDDARMSSGERWSAIRVDDFAGLARSYDVGGSRWFVAG